MSNQAYGYGSSYAPGHSGLSSLHSDRFSAPSDAFSSESAYYRTRYAYLSSAAPPPLDVVPPVTRRSVEALYHHPYPGQIEAPIYSQDYLVKRPRVDSKLPPIYPQRPGEKDCAHYMLTGTCKYGETCKFDHPIWVPHGGLPDWKEIALPPLTSYPQRPGKTECDYYMKTGECKFGDKCRFHHPLDRSAVGSYGKKQAVKLTLAGLPRREGVAICAFYMKTATCKFGAYCKFDHPPPPGEVVATASKRGTNDEEDSSDEDLMGYTI